MPKRLGYYNGGFRAETSFVQENVLIWSSLVSYSAYNPHQHLSQRLLRRRVCQLLLQDPVTLGRLRVGAQVDVA